MTNDEAIRFVKETDARDGLRWRVMFKGGEWIVTVFSPEGGSWWSEATGATLAEAVERTVPGRAYRDAREREETRTEAAREDEPFDLERAVREGIMGKPDGAPKEDGSDWHERMGSMDMGTFVRELDRAFENPDACAKAPNGRHCHHRAPFTHTIQPPTGHEHIDEVCCWCDHRRCRTVKRIDAGKLERAKHGPHDPAGNSPPIPMWPRGLP